MCNSYPTLGAPNLALLATASCQSQQTSSQVAYRIAREIEAGNWAAIEARMTRRERELMPLNGRSALFLEGAQVRVSRVQIKEGFSVTPADRHRVSVPLRCSFPRGNLTRNVYLTLLREDGVWRPVVGEFLIGLVSASRLESGESLPRIQNGFRKAGLREIVELTRSQRIVASLLPQAIKDTPPSLEAAQLPLPRGVQWRTTRTLPKP